MRHALQLLTAASAAAVLAFAMATGGCTGPATGTPDAGGNPQCEKNPLAADCVCHKQKDCSATDPYSWICTPGNRCIRICHKMKDCQALSQYDSKYSSYVCDDAICQAPVCGSDGECGTGSCCIGGSCKACPAPAAVASCQVLPANALLHQGSTKSFTVLATDADGKTVSYKGDVTWSVDQADRASVAGSSISGTVTGGAQGGTFAVKASIGSTACTAAAAVNYANASDGQVRVVVADLGSSQPIAGATVVIGAQTEVTGADGSATFDGIPAGKKTVSIFDHTHAYLTMVDVSGTDLVAYLKPAAHAGTFTGTMGARAFDNLSDYKGTVHFALYGGSIPGNLIDIQLSTLLGAMVPTTLNLGGNSKTLPLPQGTIIGLGEDMFKSDYQVLAPVGVRSVWGLGGNMDFSAITKALGPALSGGDTSNIDVGSVLTSLLPLVGKLQSGVLTGLKTTAEGTTSIDGKISLDTLLRLHTIANLPDLPTYQSAGATKHFDGAIVLGGALYSPQGLVPLGLTAGIDQKGTPDPNDPTKQLPDGKVDAAEDGLNPGQMSLQLAPLHGGLETSKYVALALAASFSGLVGGGSSDGIVLSGIINFPGDIKYSATEATNITFDKFLGVPDPTLSDRTFDLGSAVDGAAFHRIDIGSDDAEWSIYLPAGADPAQFEIPLPPEGFEDRLMAAPGETSQPKVVVQSVALGGTDGLDYDGVMTFNNDNMDDLTTRITSFSVRQIVRPDVSGD